MKFSKRIRGLAYKGVLGVAGGSAPAPPPPVVTKFVLLVIGDSNANGASNTITPCSNDTLYNFNGVSFDEITTQSVSNGFPLLGSIWQPFATEYKSYFNKPVYLVNAAKGGSYFSNDVPANSWGSGGNLRGLAETKLNDALTFLGDASLSLIIVNLGINDIRNGYSDAGIVNAIDGFGAWITSEYPGVPVLFIQVGRAETTLNSLKYYTVRKAIVDVCTNNTLCSLFSQGMQFFTGGYEVDNLHYNQASQITIAAQGVRWLRFPGFSKWGRSVVCLFVTDITLGRKVLVDNFISSQVSNGNFFQFENLTVFLGSVIGDLNVDWSFIGFGISSGATIDPNVSLSFDGVDDYFVTGVIPNVYTLRSGQNNIIVGARVLDNRSVFATLALFGSQSGALSVSIFQGPVRFRVNDNTLSEGTDTVFLDDKTYVTRRSGTTKELLVDKTVDSSVVVASTGYQPTVPQAVGCTNASPVPLTYLNCDVVYYFYAGNASFDYDSFYDEMKTLIDNW